MRLPHAGLVATLVFALNLTPFPHGPLAAELKTQISREGAVTVKVTPKDGLAGAEHWDFAVVLETHVVPLDQDMVKAAVLVDTSGGVHPAVSWEGDPPGSHHRKGVLRFRAPPVSAGSIELRIAGVGEVPLRIFRWRIGG